MSKKRAQETSHQLTLFAEDSHAGTFHPPATDLASLVLKAASGTSIFESLVSCVRDGSSSRTSPVELISGSTSYPVIWRDKATQAYRSRLKLAMSAHHSFERASSSSLARGTATWPTPQRAGQKLSRRHGYTITGHSGTTLLDAVIMHTLPHEATRKAGQRVPTPVIPNPAFVEALMGFPQRWTLPDLGHSETR